jgi:hypothetical protein
MGCPTSYLIGVLSLRTQVGISAGSRNKMEQKKTSIQGTTDWTSYALRFGILNENRAAINFELMLNGVGQA